MNLAYSEHYTVRDYEQWQGDWEIIYGTPYAMSPAPSITHQRIAKRITIMLDGQLKSCPQCEVLNEVDWQCTDDTVVRPDILIACNVEGEKLVLTPDLVIEVISPSSAKRDEILKFELYQREGVKTYILVYPKEKKLKQYRLIDGLYRKTGDFQTTIFSLTVNNCIINFDCEQVWP